MLSVHAAKSLLASSRIGIAAVAAGRVAAASRQGYRSAATSYNDEAGKTDSNAEPAAIKTAEELLAELTQVNEQLKACQETSTQEKAKADDFKDKYMRALAEAENTRRRSAIEIENQKQFAITKFAQSLLEVADIFALAAESVPKEELEKDNPALKNLHQGLGMTLDQLMKVFKRHGVEQMEPLGQKFDPNAHEALFQMDDPTKEPGTVAVVQKPGYTINGRTLRAAVVGVIREQQ